MDKPQSQVDTAIRPWQINYKYTKFWVAEITEPKLVPHEYCEPSQTLINSAVKAGKREIAGIKIYEKTSVISR